MKISDTDRKVLLRLASILPSGDSSRKVILSALRKGIPPEQQAWFGEIAEAHQAHEKRVLASSLDLQLDLDRLYQKIRSEYPKANGQASQELVGMRYSKSELEGRVNLVNFFKKL